MIFHSGNDRLTGFKLPGNLLLRHIRHMVVFIPPKFSVSETVGFLKGKCAIKIFDRHLELKKRCWGRHFWAKGYCVSTIGLDEEKVRLYVKWQQKKLPDVSNLVQCGYGDDI
jgi:putative transposase